MSIPFDGILLFLMMMFALSKEMITGTLWTFSWLASVNLSLIDILNNDLYK